MKYHFNTVDCGGTLHDVRIHNHPHSNPMRKAADNDSGND